jgi:hypothetical protein
MKVWVRVPNHMKTNLCLLSKLVLDLLLLQPWLEHNSKSCTRAELCEELTTIWKTKQTHTHTQKPTWRINPSCNICAASKSWWCMQLMRTIAMVAALVQELLLYTFDGSLLCWACCSSSAIIAYSQIRSIDILVKLKFSEKR